MFLLIPISYLIGSFPFAEIYVYMTKGIKLSKTGTKNIGVANAFQTGGVKAGLLTVIVEVMKVLFPYYFVYTYGSSELILYTSFIAVLLGIMFPFTAKFKGGKGRTAGGLIMYLIAPIPTLILLVSWTIIILTTKKAMLSSVLPTFFIPILFFIFSDRISFYFSLIIFALYLLSAKKERNDFLHYEITKE
ncbi:glycerol-3-phosphate acyltransferase [Geotoga petraea]|uniref:Acyl-phosphate glycerol-3-phosphate acyltransferase n=1 Tax=Geotoga petraea TaxID=28234 RepID=A0A1G6KM72_9BACT|nr:glycerol-3-phosphate acyltransferase [Geotoga petraea]SDC31928.1 acyl-phosphate glycerol-3-phosphate acyltransferase [Geotoga petraea]